MFPLYGLCIRIWHIERWKQLFSRVPLVLRWFAAAFLAYHHFTHFHYSRPYSNPRPIPHARWQPMQFIAAVFLAIATSLIVGLLFPYAIFELILFYVLLFFYLYLIERIRGEAQRQRAPQLSDRKSPLTMLSHNRQPSVEGPTITAKYQARCVRCQRFIDRGEIAPHTKSTTVGNQGYLILQSHNVCVRTSHTTHTKISPVINEAPQCG